MALKPVIEQAVMAAAADMQDVMGKELKKAMLANTSNLWPFKFYRNDESRRRFPYSNSKDQSGQSGSLYNSQTPFGPIATTNGILFGFEWSAVHESGREYASLVHNGGFNVVNQMDWPKTPKKGRNYSARPWTFLVTPPEQRNLSAIVFRGSVNLETLPSQGWDASYQVFIDSFRTILSSAVKVVTL